ncbi:MAG: 50S ribosomal protein L18 [Clostridia bacterium]|nr:50S ribosomal protein L18 [Clostridia bacterium]MDE6472390.1 50S ribosomal protein L18 [Clostridia bacterium]MDE7191994.1 50S ribosomal protein L18 [Clostridia bacterium]MDE7349070.1 50S ribosomal protein L18 [Clostridia bacterium]
MISKIDKNAIRQKRHQRVRSKISGTAERPRFNVYRSTNNINVQIIDDVKGTTLVSCSTLDKDMIKKVKDMTKTEAAAEVGKAVAKKALQAGITEVVFDRGGYLYTGRVKSVADGAREAGLKF